MIRLNLIASFLCGALLAMGMAGCADNPGSAETGRGTKSTLGPARAADQVPVAAPAAGKAADITAQTFVPDDMGHTQTIVPFLRTHCIKCHGPERQESGFRVDENLPNNFLTRAVAEKWSEVLDKLNAGEMPPEQELQPPAADVSRVTDWIARERLRGEKARRGTTIVLRRLNRAEYNNTIRELTGVDMQPADAFPADPAAGGFDNNGSVLSLTQLQMELYIKAAQQVLDRAIVSDEHRPASIRWRFPMEQGNETRPDNSDVPADRVVTIDGRRMFINPGNNPNRDGMTVLRRPNWDTSGDARIGEFKVPHPGYYVVRTRAAGIVPPPDDVLRITTELHKRSMEDAERKLTDPEQRRLLRESFEMHELAGIQKHYSSRHYRYGPPRLKMTIQQPGMSRILGEFDVAAPASDPAIYEVRTWVEPQSTWITFNNVYHFPKSDWNGWQQTRKEFPRPELLVDWLELEGPLYDSWPPGSHQRILIDSPNRGKNDEAYAADVLTHFMRRAYRRPLRTGEVQAKLKLFREARKERPSFEEAIKIPLIAVLSSSHFIFQVEPHETERDATRLLNDFELATRLSYFLTSNMPDDELTRLVEQGLLTIPENLVAQADRLLANTQNDQLAKNFAGQWLKLRDVGVNPPAPMIFLEYDDHLEASMRGESEAFFSHILREDLSVLNFIRSDFLTINERLARFYGVSDVKGDHFRAVPVPEGLQRGGVLTQASVLTVTSNGTRTSPVARGVWILERLLGDPPPPPPPNAGDIPPGVPGVDKATVRERLRIHREQAQCAHCHNKIDPLGFALENFDGSGQWRLREAQWHTSDYGANDSLIDARAQLPGGAEFVGVAGLQQELLKRQAQFLRCLAEHLYGYALGRELGYADEPLITSAVQDMQKNGHTLRSLIHHIVRSETFRSK